MAITTLDGVVAGMQPPQYFIKAASGTLVAGRPFSYFYSAGMPGPAAEPTPGMAGVALTTYGGQIPFNNPGTGNTYLARLQAQTSGAGGTLLLCDRLWHNSGISITATTAQSVASVAFPARDLTGTVNGVGVMIGAEVTATTGAGTPTLTLNYTNSSNVAARSGTNVIPTAASTLVGTFFPIGLQAGDVGVKSVQSITLSATWTSGDIHLVAYRVLAALELDSLNASAIDALTGGFAKLHNNTVPFLVFIPNSTVSTTVSGQVIYSQG